MTRASTELRRNAVFRHIKRAAKRGIVAPSRDELARYLGVCVVTIGNDIRALMLVHQGRLVITGDNRSHQCRVATILPEGVSTARRIKQ